MSSPDRFPLPTLELPALTLDGALVAVLPASPLDLVLREIALELTPPRWPPALAGAAIWDDIWHAVERLVSFPLNMAHWMWQLFQTTMQKVWEAANWLWDVVYSHLRFLGAAVDSWARWVWDQVWPQLQFLGGVVSSWAGWVWSQVSPKLDWLQGRLWDAANWVWGQVWPQLQFLGGVVDSWARWVWDQVWPQLQFLGGSVDSWAHWLWDQIWPHLQFAGGIVEAWSKWLWDLIDPAFHWLWDNVLTRVDDLGRWLWDKFGDVTEIIYNVGIGGATAIGEGFQNALTWLFDHVFDAFADSIKVKMGIPRKLLTGGYTTPEELLDDFEDPFPFGSMAAYALMVPGSILGLMGAASEAGSILFEPAVQKAAQIGGHTIPSFTDLRDGFLRDLFKPGVHDDWLGRAGYSQENIDIIKELYFDIPTPSDLVRMSVREVFSPDVVERFGLFEEFPAEFAKWALQAGISEMWAQAHWGAHWQLPSVGQGFDMLHRTTDDPLPGGVSGSITVGGETFNTVLSRETLDLLLRTQDYMRFWREPLTRIAYRVASRIDIRRMFRTGVVERRDVLSTYLSLGYEPPVALALTEYVTREASGVDKDAPRETIVAAYRDRLMLRGPAEEALAALEFSPDVIALFLDQADFTVEKQNVALAEDIVEADFKAGAISEDAAGTQLAMLGIPPARVDLLLGLWGRKAAVRTLTLSAAQLLRLHREGLMPETTLRERLEVLGYNEADVDYLVQLAPPEPPAEPRTLSQAQVRAALREGVIDVGEYTTRLEDWGYPPEDIAVLLDLDQPEELVKVKPLTVSQLQRAFRQGLINEASLREGLAERGYGPEAVDVLVDLAQPAVAVRVRELTVSQLQRALRQGLIDVPELRSRLLELGYVADAAEILVDLARPPAEAPPRELSVTALQRALRGDLLTEAEVEVQLIGLGISAGAVSVLIALARPEELVLERDLTIAQDQRAFREGLITEEELHRRLTARGFSALDVEILVELARPEVD